MPAKRRLQAFSRSVLMCLAVLPALGMASVSSSDGHRQTSFCDIAANPDRFSGEVVEFTAHFETDGMHWALLSHPDCRHQVMFIKGWHEAEIHIGDTPRGDEAAMIEAFRLVPASLPSNRGFSGRITGTFRTSRAHNWSEPEPFGIVALARIDDFQSEQRELPVLPRCNAACRAYGRRVR